MKSVNKNITLCIHLVFLILITGMVLTSCSQNNDNNNTNKISMKGTYKILEEDENSARFVCISDDIDNEGIYSIYSQNDGPYISGKYSKIDETTLLDENSSFKLTYSNNSYKIEFDNSEYQLNKQSDSSTFVNNKEASSYYDKLIKELNLNS